MKDMLLSVLIIIYNMFALILYPFHALNMFDIKSQGPGSFSFIKNLNSHLEITQIQYMW